MSFHLVKLMAADFAAIFLFQKPIKKHAAS
jgi:hypothetical protein